MESRAEGMSILGRVMGLRLTLRYLPTRNMAASINGAVAAKSTRQWVWSMMMPERVGPSAGAAVNIMVITPMAVPRRLGGKMLRMPLNSSGTKKAADTACTMRPASNTPKLGARAQINEPARKVAWVMSTILRVSNHWMTPAVIGVNAPITRRKPVVSHWAVVLSMWKSRMMGVSATLSRVSFR